MIVLDTTVLVYATGTEHPLRSPCRALIEAVTAGHVVATTTPEVIQELTHVRARRLDRRDAVRVARDTSALLEPLLVVDGATLSLGLRIFEESAPLGSFDAILCAAAITAGAGAIVSADRAFAGVTAITHVDPASPDFLARLETLKGG